MKHYATRGLSLVCAAALVLSGCNASSSGTVEPTVIGESGTLACVGDSITFGAGVRKTRDTDSYPAMLQTLLGDAWTVENFGNPGSTLMAGTNRPYTEQEEYQASLNMAADVYLVMLGTNDAKPDFWDTDTFVEEYETFLSMYEDVSPDAQIFLMTPPCVYAQDSDNPEYYGAMGDNVDAEVVAAVHTVAEKVGVPVIDLHTFTAEHPEWFADGLHPNKVGNSAIAQYIYYQITGTEGEITLPAVVSLPEGTVIGCVGDSTTYGSGVMKNRDTESYPALLQDLLGDSIAVENYGKATEEFYTFIQENVTEWTPISAGAEAGSAAAGEEVDVGGPYPATTDWDEYVVVEYYFEETDETVPMLIETNADHTRFNTLFDFFGDKQEMSFSVNGEELTVEDDLTGFIGKDVEKIYTFIQENVTEWAPIA